VRDLGFKYVELAGTYNLSPEKFKEALDANGLVAVAGHFPYERYRDDAEGVARDAKALGLQYAGCAWIPHQGDFDEKQAKNWIGEANYSIARGFANQNQPDKAREALEQAVTEFRRVVANYPRGEKVPAALFKEALALIDLKQPALAQARLQYLIDNFPQAEETPLARDRLTALKSG